MILACSNSKVRVGVEVFATIVFALVAIGFTEGLIGNVLLRRLCEAAFVVVFASIATVILRNKPTALVSEEKVLTIKCQPVRNGLLRMRNNWIQVPVRDIRKIWVGIPWNFPPDVTYSLEIKGFALRRTLLFWKTGSAEPFLYREFATAAATDKLLAFFRREGIPVEDGNEELFPA
jgi:hypothetical protein